MTKKNFLKLAAERLYTMFGEALKFSQFTDADGNVYQYSTLEVGADVSIAGAEGSEPAPNGEYKVDDTTSIVVEDGKIAEVKVDESKESADDTLEVEAAEDTISEEAPVAEEEVSADYEAFIEQLLSGMEALSARVDELESKVNSVDAKAEDAIAAAEDAEDKAEAVAEGFSKMTKESKGSKLSFNAIESKFEPNKNKNVSALQSYFAGRK